MSACSGWWNWSMTCGSGFPNWRANARNVAGVKRWRLKTRTCEAKNASHTARKSPGMRSVSAPKPALSLFNSMHREQLFHARACKLRIGEQSRRVGEAEELGEMQDRARRLLPADHDEMLLVAVQPGHEHYARLVEARRRLEDVPRERDGGRQNLVI